MGNCCGSESKSSGFAGEGRTLGTTPASAPPSNAATAPLPSSVGRQVGGAGEGRSAGAADAARKAALDRMERSNASPKGKLGENLAQQKKQTMTDTLEEAAREQRILRETDANTKNLQHS